jgi:hypothetical protein
MNFIIQPSIDHLIVERRLNDDKEMLILNHLFPNVKYLELLLPSDKHSFMNCLNILGNQNDIDKKNNYLWSKLIHVSTELWSVHEEIISNDKQLYDWFIRYANLKDDKKLFHRSRSSLTLSIWY